MDNNEVIVALARRNLELQADHDNLTIEYEDTIQARDTLKGYLEDIRKALDYDGHPGNMANLIRDRFRESN